MNLTNWQTLNYVFTTTTRWIGNTVAVSLLQAIPLLWLWNFVIPAVFMIKAITFAQAVAIIFIVKILSRSWISEGIMESLVTQSAQLAYQNGLIYNALVFVETKF
ncbi:MAG: hypothetical protein JWP44_5147, partial [Mucilaginibacter sp.]|nr:hypothetical protein [Mucilaginibacter sp.]